MFIFFFNLILLIHIYSSHPLKDQEKFAFSPVPLLFSISLTDEKLLSYTDAYFMQVKVMSAYECKDDYLSVVTHGNYFTGRTVFCYKPKVVNGTLNFYKTYLKENPEIKYLWLTKISDNVKLFMFLPDIFENLRDKERKRYFTFSHELSKICVSSPIYDIMLEYIFKNKGESNQNIIDSWTLSTRAKVPFEKQTQNKVSTCSDFIPFNETHFVCESYYFNEIKSSQNDYIPNQYAIHHECFEPQSQEWNLGVVNFKHEVKIIMDELKAWCYKELVLLCEFVLKELELSLEIICDKILTLVTKLNETYMLTEYMLIDLILLIKFKNITITMIINVIIYNIIGFKRTTLDTLLKFTI